MFRSVESNVLKAAVQSGATSTARVKENIKTAIDSSAHPQLGVIRKSKALSNAMDREKRKSNGTTGRVPTEPQDIIDSLPERLKKTSAGAPFLIHNGYIDDDGTLLANLLCLKAPSSTSTVPLTPVPNHSLRSLSFSAVSAISGRFRLSLIHI